MAKWYFFWFKKVDWIFTEGYNRGEEIIYV